MLRMFDENHYSVQVLSVVTVKKDKTVDLPKLCDMVQFQYNTQIGKSEDNLNLLVIKEEEKELIVYVLDLEMLEKTRFLSSIGEFQLLIDYQESSDGEVAGVIFTKKFYELEILSRVLID